MPPSRKKEVDTILELLRRDDEELHQELCAVPLEQWCQAYMPSGTHGHTLNNMAEVSAGQLLCVRAQVTLLGSLLSALLWAKRRWKELYDECSSIGAQVRPPRQQAELENMLKRAREINCNFDREGVPPLQILNGSGKVTCQRQGPATLRSGDGGPDATEEARRKMRAIWQCVSGAPSTTQQFHTVSINDIQKGEWAKVCVVI